MKHLEMQYTSHAGSIATDALITLLTDREALIDNNFNTYADDDVVVYKNYLTPFLSLNMVTAVITFDISPWEDMPAMQSMMKVFTDAIEAGEVELLYGR